MIVQSGPYEDPSGCLRWRFQSLNSRSIALRTIISTGARTSRKAAEISIFHRYKASASSGSWPARSRYGVSRGRLNPLSNLSHSWFLTNGLLNVRRGLSGEFLMSLVARFTKSSVPAILTEKVADKYCNCFPKTSSSARRSSKTAPRHSRLGAVLFV